MAKRVEQGEVAGEAFALGDPGAGTTERLPKPSNTTGSGRRYKQGPPRHHAMLLPPSVDDDVGADNLARAIDAHGVIAPIARSAWHVSGVRSVSAPAGTFASSRGLGNTFTVSALTRPTTNTFTVSAGHRLTIPAAPSHPTDLPDGLGRRRWIALCSSSSDRAPS